MRRRKYGLDDRDQIGSRGNDFNPARLIKSRKAGPQAGLGARKSGSRARVRSPSYQSMMMIIKRITAQTANITRLKIFVARSTPLAFVDEF
jgi:hypothetical protein